MQQRPFGCVWQAQVLNFHNRVIAKRTSNYLNMQEGQANCRVKVAIRVRPFIAKELTDSEESCVRTSSKTHIVLGRDRQFKFDRVFDQNSSQGEVYNQCVNQLVMRCFEGYNAAILAYGQTGSGKTYTMGTSLGYATGDHDLGILPRVISSLFQQIHKRQQNAQFTIYNQQINDLLCSDLKTKGRTPPAVVEDKGTINIVGLTEQTVTTALELMSILEKGSLQRSTSSTLMNDTSSRSHAIFTISIKQEGIVEGNIDKQQGCVVAKFHFVDLAGSERIKKTGATGSTLRQGININMGLLCLGNVINALTNPQSKNNFVPYRDSKLTRILQDSLGGNSNTYMIACVSPAESNYEESSSTLRYAARAMNIKNKPIVNRDPQSAMIAQLRQQVAVLQADNRRCRSMLKEAGIKVQQPEPQSQSQQLVSVNHQQLQTLKSANSLLQRKLEQIQSQMLRDRKRLNEAEIELLEAKRDRDLLKLRLDDIIKENPSIQVPELAGKTDTLDGYLQTIQQLKTQVADKQKANTQLNNQYEQLLASSKREEELMIATTKQNYRLKRQIIELYKSKAKQTNNSVSHEQTTIQEHSCDITELHEQTNLEQDGEYATRQQEFESQTKKACEVLSSVNQTIVEKQKLLRDMTNNQIDLEYRLISDMKQEYHTKIRNLEREKERLEKEMAGQKGGKDQSRDKLVVSLKAKRDSLQLQLREYKKKEKQQQSLQKLVDNQKSKINQLSTEIKNFKMQKLELNRKLKDDRDLFDKFKLERLKEVLDMKKKTLEKDHAIRKLTIENKRTQQNALKKDEETKKLKRINDTLKQILQPKTKNNKRGTVMPHLQNQQNTSSTTQSIDYQAVVDNILCKLICELDLQAQIRQYQTEIESLQKQLDKYLEKDTRLKLQLQKLQIKAQHFRSGQQVTAKIEEHKIKLSETTLVMENLQENIEYTRGKYQTLLKSDIKKFQIETELLYNKSYDSMDSMRKIVGILVNRSISMFRDQIKDKETLGQRQVQITNLKAVVEQRQQQMHVLNMQHQENLSKLREELLMHYYPMDQIQTLQQMQTKQIRNQDKGDKKTYEKKINDLNKRIKQLTMELDQSKRKCEVVAQKYQNIKKIGHKDKFVGRVTSRQDEDLRLTTFSQKRLERTNTTSNSQTTAINSNNTAILQEVTSMMQNLCNQPTAITKQVSQKQQPLIKQQSQCEQSFQGSYFWQTMATFEGHTNPVLSITCHSNMLISTSMKSLKLWDLQTNKIISDLAGNYLNGFVKCVAVQPQKRIMVTACDKAITLWDLVSLQVISTLKAHKDEVRVLHIANDMLYSAGKGGPSASSIFSWDFRSINPLYQAERNQDIFSLSSNKGILYYGSRNHQVRRLNLENMEALAPFDPPHFDTVTCLASTGDYLISGSKDKNLKLWSVETPVKNLRCTSYAHNDYINTLQAGIQSQLFYSGSRNGQVKVGTIMKDRIQYLGNVDCHSQSVNSLCIIQQTSEAIFATGSADKTIKLWRPTLQTQHLLQSEQFYLNE